jgi:glycosyltransferase involved in cell wall biosynthesis
MRILQLLSAFQPNGAVSHCLDLSRELSRCGHQVLLGHRLNEVNTKRFEGEPIELVDCSFRRWPTQELRRIAKLVQEREIDLIHTHMSSAHLFGVLLRWGFGIPCIATAHCSLFQPHWCWNDYVIAVSQSTARFHRRCNLVPRSKLAVVYSAIETNRFDQVDEQAIAALRADWSLPADALTIGIVGDVVPRKGQLSLVRALPEILKKHPGAKLIVVGACENRDGFNVDDSYIAQVKETATSLGVTEHLIWQGYTRNIAPIMRAIDVCVVPSLNEPFGLVAAEAMAAGTPVVASKVGGLVDIVTSEENGLLVQPNRPDLLAAQILRLFDDAAFRKRLGDQGKKSIKSRFSTEQQLNQVQSIYESVLSRRSNRHRQSLRTVTMQKQAT